MSVCKRPPLGWSCSREADHDGPCAATKREFTIGDLMNALDERDAARAKVTELTAALAKALVQCNAYGNEVDEARGERDRIHREYSKMLSQLDEMTRQVSAMKRDGMFKAGFDFAEKHAEISTTDGWNLTNPYIDWEEARKKLRTYLADGLNEKNKG